MFTSQNRPRLSLEPLAWQSRALRQGFFDVESVSLNALNRPLPVDSRFNPEA